MVVLEAVVEVFGLDDFTTWPVAGEPEGGFLRLSDSMAEGEIGSVMAVIANYNHLLEPVDEEGGPRRRRLSAAERAEIAAAATADSAFRRLIAAECIIAPGGLRVRDTDSDAAVSPGCCSGLEAWREEWFGALKGREPWLGHSPSPDVRITGKSVRLRPDEHDDNSPVLEIPLAALPGMLAGVQQDLGGFLLAVHGWAQVVAPDLADGVISALDRHFEISSVAPFDR